MILIIRILSFIAVLLPGINLNAASYDFGGFASLETRLFSHTPLYSQQEHHNVSLALQPEFDYEWQNGTLLTFTGFARLDSSDEERSRVDIRELSLFWPTDLLETRIGISKIYWGVTEFFHLVDIINQTDLIESLDMEEKLGQPMLQLTMSRDWGTVDFFILPYFRERTFPGIEGRLRAALIVDHNTATYESSDKEHHIDLALRFSNTVGNWDFGLSHFRGTGREPLLSPTRNQAGESVLSPFYEQISQTSFDIQGAIGSWLLKFEALHRNGSQEEFYAATGGVEYTFYNLGSTSMDLGIIGEWAWDERGEEATTLFDNDLMLGLRLAVNDQASTEALFGIAQDADSSARILTLEASRRLTDGLKISCKAAFFLDFADDDPGSYLRQEDFFFAEIKYYF